MLKKSLETIKTKISNKGTKHPNSGNRKYELVYGDYKDIGETRYFRIKALRYIERPLDLPPVEVGDLGGYVSREDCLSHDGSCWVDDMALVSGYVTGEAQVSGQAVVQFPSTVSGTSYVSDYARVLYGAHVDDSKVIHTATVTGNETMLTLAKNNGVEYDTPVRETRVIHSVIMDNAHISSGAHVKNSTVTGNVYLAGNVSVKNGSVVHGAIVLAAETDPITIDSVALDESANSNGSPNVFLSGSIGEERKATPDSCDFFYANHKLSGVSSRLSTHLADYEKLVIRSVESDSRCPRLLEHWRDTNKPKATWGTRNPENEPLNEKMHKRIIGVAFRSPSNVAKEVAD